MTNTKVSNNYLKIIAALLSVVFVVAGVLLGLELWDKNRGNFGTVLEADNTIVYNGKEYVLNQNVETFLVLGLDKFEGASSNDSYNNDKQADFLMLFVFDNDAKKWSVININRDTMAKINVLGVAGNKVDTVTKQIALAHTYGNGRNVSCQNVANSVSVLFGGVKINHYISFDLDSVSIVNDLAGGVTLTVLDDFSTIDPTLKKGETVTLMGDKALTYVRTRYGLEDSSNSTRMERQKQYLEALYQKLAEKSNTDSQFILNVLTQLDDHIISDRSVTQLKEISEKCMEYEQDAFLTIEGKNKMGEKYVEFYPSQDSLDKIMIDLFYKPKS